jgi:hypothetical protein
MPCTCRIFIYSIWWANWIIILFIYKISITVAIVRQRSAWWLNRKQWRISYSYRVLNIHVYARMAFMCRMKHFRAFLARRLRARRAILVAYHVPAVAKCVIKMDRAVLGTTNPKTSSRSPFYERALVLFLELV